VGCRYRLRYGGGWGVGVEGRVEGLLLFSSSENLEMAICVYR
jgi:hypothetical protein